MRSLEAFIECNGQWERAAQQLYCHRHTLRYRIRRIEELTGRDIYQQTFVRNPRNFGLPGGYQGTSMAAPHVSAIAALVIATERIGANPTPGQVAAHLRRTAVDLGPDGYDSRYGHGLIGLGTCPKLRKGHN